MGFSSGLVGLPNVGKSTLFNALTQSAQALVANYPFATIEPNRADVPIHDPRLEQLAHVAQSRRVVPALASFTDVAGLVRGASKGEGLGNQFLGHIRELDAVIHVLRCFSPNDPSSHVEGRINPADDAELVDAELALADIQSLEKRIPSLIRKARSLDPDDQLRLDAAQLALQSLNNSSRAVPPPPDSPILPHHKQLNLLTDKPLLYLANVDESALQQNNNPLVNAAAQYARSQNAPLIIVAAETEAQLVSLPSQERTEYLAELGVKLPGVQRLADAAHKLLNLITFFTAGPDETRAWTIPRGAEAPQAAGRIHSDMQRGFIRAETISWNDFVNLGGEAAARAGGASKAQGRNYVVQDGDVLHFRFSVLSSATASQTPHTPLTHPTADMTPIKYWEDYKIGESLTFGNYLVTQKEIMDFAKRFDPQPFHLDPVAAKNSPAGGLIASGWHTAAVLMRLVWEGSLKNTATGGAPGVDEMRWINPVRPNDRLRCTRLILNKRPSKSKPDVGLLHNQMDVFNQHDEHKAHMRIWTIMGRRPT